MASVTFKRGTRAEIEATAKQDGQILMETDQNKKNKMYIDLPDDNRVLIGNSGEAIDISYDNTTSGLDVTNVQNAIDKIENNVGDISGITDSLTATSSNIALSAAGGNNLQGQIDTLNSSLTQLYFIKTQKRYLSYSNEVDSFDFNDLAPANGYYRVLSEVSFSGTNAEHLNCYNIEYTNTCVRPHIKMDEKSITFSGDITVTTIYISNKFGTTQ